MIDVSIKSPGEKNQYSYRKFKNIYYFGYPCATKTSCEPFKVVFKYRTIACVELWGAKGGSANSQYSSPGAIGGYSVGKLIFRRKTPYYFYIGAMGEPNGKETFGGGAKGTYRSSGDGKGFGGGSGGGATDIRLIFGDSEEALKSRIIVAAGGAGSEVYGMVIPGGFGGGAYGGNATTNYYGNSNVITEGSGATPFSGGLGYHGTKGQLGNGSTYPNKYYGAGGGGGYYGGGSGGSGSSIVMSGGGGSSFISGINGWNVVFCRENSHRFISGRTISGDQSLPKRFDIKSDTTQLDGLLKLTIISIISNASKYNIRLMLLIKIIVLSS